MSGSPKSPPAPPLHPTVTQLLSTTSGSPEDFLRRYCNRGGAPADFEPLSADEKRDLQSAWRISTLMGDSVPQRIECTPADALPHALHLTSEELIPPVRRDAQTEFEEMIAAGRIRVSVPGGVSMALPPPPPPRPLVTEAPPPTPSVPCPVEDDVAPMVTDDDRLPARRGVRLEDVLEFYASPPRTEEFDVPVDVLSLENTAAASGALALASAFNRVLLGVYVVLVPTPMEKAPVPPERCPLTGRRLKDGETAELTLVHLTTGEARTTLVVSAVASWLHRCSFVVHFGRSVRAFPVREDARREAAEHWLELYTETVEFLRRLEEALRAHPLRVAQHNKKPKKSKPRAPAASSSHAAAPKIFYARDVFPIH
jgi:hypothetical protein